MGNAQSGDAKKTSGGRRSLPAVPPSKTPPIKHLVLLASGNRADLAPKFVSSERWHSSAGCAGQDGFVHSGGLGTGPIAPHVLLRCRTQPCLGYIAGPAGLRYAQTSPSLTSPMYLNTLATRTAPPISASCFVPIASPTRPPNALPSFAPSHSPPTCLLH